MLENEIYVPIEHQLKNHCGPSSLSMVLNYYGANTDQEEVSLFFPPSRDIFNDGVYTKQIKKAARDMGFWAKSSENNTIDDLIHHIDNEEPVIVRMRSRFNRAHFIVVTGYKKEPGYIYLSDPGDKWEKFSIKEFKDRWNIRRKYGQTKNYMLVVKPSEETKTMKNMLEVPILRQLPNHCGPTSLAMVLNYYGTKISKEEVREYFPKGRNIFEDGIASGGQIVTAAKRLGFQAKGSSANTINDLIKQIDKGIPPIVVIKYNGRLCHDESASHVLVIDGYDRYHDYIYVSDPLKERRRYEYKDFEKLWENREGSGIDNCYMILVKK